MRIDIETLEKAGDHAQGENLIDMHGWEAAKQARYLADTAHGSEIPYPTVRPQPDSHANWHRLALTLEWQIHNEARRNPSDATGARATDHYASQISLGYAAELSRALVSPDAAGHRR